MNAEGGRMKDGGERMKDKGAEDLTQSNDARLEAQRVPGSFSFFLPPSSFILPSAFIPS
jgi:hypothetical protein